MKDRHAFDRPAVTQEAPSFLSLRDVVEVRLHAMPTPGTQVVLLSFTFSGILLFLNFSFHVTTDLRKCSCDHTTLHIATKNDIRLYLNTYPTLVVIGICSVKCIGFLNSGLW